ncbi:hypothetical protein LZ32DRAFT_332781 [Colletotrichum eremochloae]|nr:hypothetical protein LZ32DRAFT_332781 [Colletotrichum eremochloae]
MKEAQQVAFAFSHLISHTIHIYTNIPGIALRYLFPFSLFIINVEHPEDGTGIKAYMYIRRAIRTNATHSSRRSPSSFRDVFHQTSLTYLHPACLESLPA